MTSENELFEEMIGANAAYAQSLYKHYQKDPASVPSDWRRMFEQASEDWALFFQEQMNQKPLARGISGRGLSLASNENSAGVCMQPKDVQQSVAALMMVRAYRSRGHLSAKLDPLGLNKHPRPPELQPDFFGFTDADMDTEIYLGGSLGLESAPLRKIIKILEQTYCGTHAVEFVHLMDPDEKLWIQQKIEGYVAEKVLTNQERLSVLQQLIEAESLEKFINTKHVGAKRFGIDGLEAFIPALHEILRVSSKHGVEEVIMGMAHRGRLNVLCNVMEKPLESVFAEFLGTVQRDGSMDSGDVKYHLGFETDIRIEDRQMHVCLSSNPSHLESIDPVMLGETRAKQDLKNDTDHDHVMAILVHGDAAFIGQGVVAECFGFSKVQGYGTGGTVHVVLNNQIGFTTNPADSRSSPHCTEIAKTVQAPIFHVNGDDIDAVVFMARLAADFRRTFKKDVVLDIVGYRRFGHNEGDDPTFTQPQMYKAIKNHKSVRDYYEQTLLKADVVSAQDIETISEQRSGRLQTAYDQAMQGYRVEETRSRQRGEAYLQEKENQIFGIAAATLKAYLKKLVEVPEGFSIHSRLERLLKARAAMRERGERIDWSTAEALAIASLVSEGVPVRLSGQDSVRGTFSQRHAAWIDQENEEAYIPLNHLSKKQATFEPLNSPLSEFAIVGFDYGYSSANPKALVMWEAQFGDFANGAQVIFDQYISAAEVKWQRLTSLVVLLPHGYEGQGPEHSSARVERFLTACAENNMIVANCTTPANYFHILRRQALAEFQKPLILLTPKSLLRHADAVSSLADMGPKQQFQPVLKASNQNAKKVKRIVLCSGKVYYDLMEQAAKRSDVAVIRVEQLYPFPTKALAEALEIYDKESEVIWCQEEPENMGAWQYMDRRLEGVLESLKFKQTRVRYAGRAAAAATASGYPALHTHKQQKLIEQALKR